MDKIGVGRGASEQNINYCLKRSKRVLTSLTDMSMSNWIRTSPTTCGQWHMLVIISNSRMYASLVCEQLFKKINGHKNCRKMNEGRFSLFFYISMISTILILRKKLFQLIPELIFVGNSSPLLILNQRKSRCNQVKKQ